MRILLKYRQNTALLHCSNLVTIGTCFWSLPDFCCERRQDLFYVFDWDTKTWSNQYIHTVYPEEYPGGAVEVSMEFLQDDLDCVGIKWPECIQNGTGNFVFWQNVF